MNRRRPASLFECGNSVGAETLLRRRSEIVMPFTHKYTDPEPTRPEVEALSGLALLEFGAASCGYCQRAEPVVAEALAETPVTHHIKISDGSTRRLGRYFGVKLWPTLVFLKDGKEFARVVRPFNAEVIRRALKGLP